MHGWLIGCLRVCLALLDLFNAELSPERCCRELRYLMRWGNGGKGEGGGLYLTLRCHHQNDSA